MTNLRKAYPYGWTRKPTYEELENIFDRCRELHQEAENKLKEIQVWADEINSRLWNYDETQEITTLDIGKLLDILSSKQRVKKDV